MSWNKYKNINKIMRKSEVFCKDNLKLLMCKEAVGNIIILS
jgi:hypothetical protein